MNLFNLGGLISKPRFSSHLGLFHTLIVFSFCQRLFQNLYIIRYLRDCVNERIVNNRGDKK